MRASQNRLGAASSDAENVVASAHAFETFARGVVANINNLRGVTLALASSGYDLGVMDPGHGTMRAIAFVRGYRELELGRASLQPYQLRGDDEVRFAIVKTGTQLGWFPIALKVIQIAGTALASGAAVYIADAWLEARNADATANRMRAETEAGLATLAAQLKSSGDNAGATRLAESIARASGAGTAAAQGGDTSWVDSLKTAAVGASSSVALVFIALYFMNRKGKRGRA